MRSIAGCDVVSHPEWTVAQQLLASALHRTNAVAYSGHFNKAEQPAMVVEAIRKVVDQVRDRNP